MRRTTFMVITVMLTSATVSAIPKVIINEILASNSRSFTDPQGQHDDWIELHNTHDEAIDVGGMYLTDDLSQPMMWWIPTTTTIPAHGYLLIWADNDIEDAGQHTNFKLDADGEELGLFDIDGDTPIDTVQFGPQRANISFGRYPNASNNWRLLASPTPETPNVATYAGLIADVEFSRERGIYDSPFELTITCATPGATIYYTLDGSEPGKTTGRYPNGTTYTEPIRITQTTCLRVRAVKPDWKSSPVATHTYLFPEDVAKQSVISIPVTHARGQDTPLTEALLALPTISLVTPHTISETETTTSIELIRPDGHHGFQMDAGVEHYGGHSLGYSKKSMRISFKAAYGVTKLKYDLFGDDAAQEFNQFILRSGSHDSLFNDWWTGGIYIRNRWMMDRQLDMGHAAPRGRFVHVYINGIYWGQYHLMERPNGAFMASYVGGNKDDYDVVKGKNGIRALSGDLLAWNTMLAALNDYTTLHQYIDMVNYIDYMLLEFYGGNDHDWWPNWNWMAARKRTVDAGFVFFAWDNDFILRTDLHANVIDGLSPHRPEKPPGVGPSGIWDSIIQHEEFRMLQADRAQKLFFNNGILTPDQVLAQFQALSNRIEKSMLAETARWGKSYNYTPATWQEKLDTIRTEFVSQRTGVVIAQMRAAGVFPLIDAPVFHINGAPQHGGNVLSTDVFSMSASSGTLYYTLDGSDPRQGRPVDKSRFSANGGAVSPSALEYANPMTLNQSVHIESRLLDGSTWSALNETVFAVGPVVENLRITEIMYHPPDTSDPNAEFVELQNIGLEPINLNLVRFTKGINFVFPSLELAPGRHVLVIRDITAFEAVYGLDLNVAGQYTGNLSNSGERLHLENALGQTILDFRYSDNWQEPTDGQGFSLTLVDPVANDPNDWDFENAWRTSALPGGSPSENDGQ